MSTPNSSSDLGSSPRPSKPKSTKTRTTTDKPSIDKGPVVVRSLVKHEITISRSKRGTGGKLIRAKNGARVVVTLVLGSILDDKRPEKPSPQLELSQAEWRRFMSDKASRQAIDGLRKTGQILVLND